MQEENKAEVPQVSVSLGPPVQSADFRSFYANNVFFEVTAFDLKMTLGEVMSMSKTPHVEQRGAITMAWLEAKIAAIYFLANVMIHELAYGVIPIPSVILPPFVPPEQAKAPIETIVAAITPQVAADVAAQARAAREASKKEAKE
ncbi:MAG: hypothetical protein WA188_08020 [Terriglobales bacterium]